MLVFTQLNLVRPKVVLSERPSAICEASFQTTERKILERFDQKKCLFIMNIVSNKISVVQGHVQNFLKNKLATIYRIQTIVLHFLAIKNKTIYIQLC